jgi:hypothetical protein
MMHHTGGWASELFHFPLLRLTACLISPLLLALLISSLCWITAVRVHSPCLLAVLSRPPAISSVSPWGRLEPLSLAADVVNLMYTVVERTVAQSGVLQDQTDVLLRMSGEEFTAFQRLQFK